jgi:hypothetical protein
MEKLVLDGAFAIEDSKGERGAEERGQRKDRD